MAEPGPRVARVGVSRYRAGAVVTTVVWGEFTEDEASLVAAHAEDAINRIIRVMEVGRQEDREDEGC